MKTLETAILRELRVVASDNKIRMKDVMEWRTGHKLKVQEGEVLYYLPVTGISCAVRKP